MGGGTCWTQNRDQDKPTHTAQKETFNGGAYHFLSFGATSLFTFAVVDIACAGGIGSLMQATSHELVEAATDPIITAGWINNSISNAPPPYLRLQEGEASDMCKGTALLNGVAVATYSSNSAGQCVSH